MYLEEIAGKLPDQDVRIKYDCAGGFKMCGQERTMNIGWAKSNFTSNGGKHICRSCVMSANNPMKRKDVRDKIKKTCLEKYGTEMPMNKKELVEERKAKFKDEEFKKQWVEKHRQTSLERYGVEHPMHLDETKERQKKTVQEKYGVDHPMRSEKVKKKARKTNMERYGVENAAQAPEVRVKMAQTTLKRYGVEYYNQLPEMKDYLRENCRDWLAESWANPWAKGIVRPEEWNQKQSQTMTRLLIEGKLVCSHKGSIRGYYESSKCMGKKPFFRSHLELLVHFHLSNNEDVIHYQYEPFAIPIIDEHGRQRLYVPDFQVFYKSKTRPVIVECKPEYMIEKKDNPIKFNHMRAFVTENELEFEIWSEQLIHGFGNYKQILELPQVTRI